jgi:hypothetical protein
MTNSEVGITGDRWKWALWAVLFVIGLFGVFGPRIPQAQSYHQFADQRAWLEIPHFADVASNLAFLIVGAWGVIFVLGRLPGARSASVTPRERWPYLVFFLGVLFTAFGSAYYHWAPDNARLVWDRLPMAMGFMGLLSAVLGERLAPALGNRSLAPLLCVGIGSVLYWRWTDLVGRDDLKLYGIVQFGSVALVLGICMFFPSRYSRSTDIFGVVALYALAKIFEAADKPIYSLGEVVSGHTLKHLCAAAACYLVLRMLMLRQLATIEPARH